MFVAHQLNLNVDALPTIAHLLGKKIMPTQSTSGLDVGMNNYVSKLKVSVVPIKSSLSSSLNTRLVLINLDVMDEFQMEVIERYDRCCPGNGSLKVVKQVKEGFELDKKCYCGFCKKSYEMSTSAKIDEDSGVAEKRGRQIILINKTMATAMFKLSAPAAQVQEIFVENDIT